MVKAHYSLFTRVIPTHEIAITKSTNTVTKLAQTAHTQSEEAKAKNDVISAFKYFKDYHTEEGLELLSPQGVDMGPMGGSITESDRSWPPCVDMGQSHTLSELHFSACKFVLLIYALGPSCGYGKTNEAIDRAVFLAFPKHCY